jgi:hypothetical protein
MYLGVLGAIVLQPATFYDQNIKNVEELIVLLVFFISEKSLRTPLP